jgi:ATP dependent DNA ligase C terminal region
VTPCLAAALQLIYSARDRGPLSGSSLDTNYTGDGTGMPVKVLADLRRRLEPLSRAKSPLSVPPPRKTRFGSPLVLSRVHWVEPKLVAEITYLTWPARCST